MDLNNEFTDFERYLTEFRVEQCQSFLQHKCNQHRPFVCFNWHFMNQRRRRPVRKRDGTFNYSADNYCTKYDETTGICPDGDECPYLHRTAGDTERRYHLRYYKTCMCVHDTDIRGYCSKNGLHCAFAHGLSDQRPPVYDIKELEALQNGENNGGPDGCLNGPNALDKERNLMNEDPKWQDTNYVLSNYKTEPCKRPPRLCRQGYACPQYHNSKDKRRSPRKFKYRSTPCPNVKHGEEWGEPANCESGDNCQYCHTRTEQQFHPEIYKSTKCNDVQQAGYCPRSVFCAFAHVEQIDSGSSLFDGANLIQGETLSNEFSALLDKAEQNNHNFLQNGNNNYYGGESCESASTSSSIGSNNSHSKAPGAQLQHQIAMTAAAAMAVHPVGLSPFHNFSQDVTRKILANDIDHPMGPLEQEHRNQLYMSFKLQVGGDRQSNSFDELARRDMAGHLENSLGGVSLSSAPVNIPVSPMSNCISGLLQGASAPVNIPGSTLNNFSPTATKTNHTNHVFSMNELFSHSAPKICSNNSFNGGCDNLFYNTSHLISPNTLSISPDLRMPDLRDDIGNNSSVNNSFFENSLTTHNKPFSMSPLGGLNEINRLRDEFKNSNNQMQNNWGGESQWMHASNKQNDPWKLQVEDLKRDNAVIEQQRDEAVNRLQQYERRYDINNLPQDIRGLSIQQLKGYQTKLRSDLEEVEKELYSKTATKCMECEENTRSVTLVPCNHYALCDVCAKVVEECPYCKIKVTPLS